MSLIQYQNNEQMKQAGGAFGFKGSGDDGGGRANDDILSLFASIHHEEVCNRRQTTGGLASSYGPTARHSISAGGAGLYKTTEVRPGTQAAGASSSMSPRGEAGIGVLLKRITNAQGETAISIVGLAASGPAAQSGEIEVGDEVVSVDGWAVRASAGGVTCRDVMQRLVGAPSTPVVLTLERPDSATASAKTFRVFLTRGAADSSQIGRRKGRASLPASSGAASSSSSYDPWAPLSSFGDSKGLGLEADAAAKASQYVDDLFSSTKALLRQIELRSSSSSDISPLKYKTFSPGSAAPSSIPSASHANAPLLTLPDESDFKKQLRELREQGGASAEPECA
jgi:hypothetical protein